MRNESFAPLFRRTLIMIVAASAAASALTCALAYYLFTKSLGKDIYPADYYERQIPGIEAYVREKSTELLVQEGGADLAGVIRGEDISYQVVDNDGNILYGTHSQKLFDTRDELFDSFLNTTIFRDGYYIHTVPITEAGGNIEGAVLLSYQIKMTFANDRGRLTAVAIGIALFSPFMYIIGFTFLFSRILAEKINYPLRLLTDAAKNIREKNLDFEIDYHSDNELGRLCSAFSDMKEELKSSLSAQWHMEQERVFMTEALAHDLKSPLSVILAYTDALLDSTPDDSEKWHRYLSVIKANTEKSASLVQRMQDAADLERPDIQPQPTAIDIQELLSQKVQDYRLQSCCKDIELALDIHGDLLSPVRTDAEMLSRIIDNIISNSMQYTPRGGRITIDVSLEKERVCYRICDSGPGFGSQDLQKAFDRFYRGDIARSTKGGHSGLGLYIVKQLAEQLGGSAEIENSSSGGACVIFWHSV